MLARIRKAQENEGGFTLIELLVVIIIIGILAAIAIPTFLKQREKGYKAAMKSDLKNSATAEESWATDHDGAYTTVVGVAPVVGTNLMGEGYNASPSVTVTVPHINGAGNSACYVLKAVHAKLPGDVWYYSSTTGSLSENTDPNDCV